MSTTEIDRSPRGEQAAAISNLVVKLTSEYTGRGPTKARTHIHEDLITVILRETLTKGEQVLVKNGRAERVLALRHEYQEAMREESSAKVAELTGQSVTAMMSANHLDPDLAAEIYVLEGPPEHAPRGLTDSQAITVSWRTPS